RGRNNIRQERKTERIRRLQNKNKLINYLSPHEFTFYINRLFLFLRELHVRSEYGHINRLLASNFKVTLAFFRWELKAPLAGNISASMRKLACPLLKGKGYLSINAHCLRKNYAYTERSE
ncbi:MAG TPA: hypothetical protein PK624_10350, partial [Spirochaetota bacterium]|nr:hypothetical protein [Spirochaetota bacterium]